MKQHGKKTAPSGKAPVDRLILPFQEFFEAEASGGILLLVCTVIALVLANSPLAGHYMALWQTPLTVGPGAVALSKPLYLWINDGLMAVFFFVVGLEIKREILTGELASPRQAALPIAGAIGGMLVPALIYVGFNLGTGAIRGWGIPMATDIAFAIGILSLMGKRAPLSLKVFLTALAIVDDMGAVLVIAIFYTSEISLVSLAVGAVFLALLIGANRLGVRRTLVYALLGTGLWVAFLKSGIHATIAGVLLAMTIPSSTRITGRDFTDSCRAFLKEFESADTTGGGVIGNDTQRAAVQAIETACHQVESPMQRLEHSLHPWVAFFIMPVFALANAGVSLGDSAAAALGSSVALGVAAGLFIGKPVGVLFFSWLSVKMGVAAMPPGTTWRQFLAVGCFAGIGFTMSLFIAALAFGGSEELDMAKIGILGASAMAALAGWFLLRTIPEKG
ncbi:MAG: Na+/H+ antiporter NhaA [Spirochaetes bacterium]|mgnify:CR=1 FL=1|jgi:NhaA family Na+:H+ antiporter|nr:Na+/H+ antiporter NhaA [Spirochaetota bacterium]